MRQNPEFSAALSPHSKPEPCPGQLPVTLKGEAADGSADTIRLNQDRVRITRHDGSHEIVHIVPIDDYIGLVIAARHAPDGEIASVTLRHLDPALNVCLNTASHDHEIDDLMRAWSIWADSLGVEKLVEMADGLLEPVPDIGKVRVTRRRVAPRRANPHFRTRRPNMMQGMALPPRLDGLEIIARH